MTSTKESFSLISMTIATVLPIAFLTVQILTYLY